MVVVMVSCTTRMEERQQERGGDVNGILRSDCVDDDFADLFDFK